MLLVPNVSVACMPSFPGRSALYSIYISNDAVTVRLEDGLSSKPGKLFCSHNIYRSAYRLACEIAQYRRLQLLDLVALQRQALEEPARPWNLA